MFSYIKFIQNFLAFTIYVLFAYFLDLSHGLKCYTCRYSPTEPALEDYGFTKKCLDPERDGNLSVECEEKHKSCFIYFYTVVNDANPNDTADVLNQGCSENYVQGSVECVDVVNAYSTLNHNGSKTLTAKSLKEFKKIQQQDMTKPFPSRPGSASQSTSTENQNVTENGRICLCKGNNNCNNQIGAQIPTPIPTTTDSDNIFKVITSVASNLRLLRGHFEVAAIITVTTVIKISANF